ncbi:hypothetical protein Pla108_02900 [Botrimarina colliarenosi]|uniref:DUF5698 domain-containing protein n=1 Tax=Botrimarina colliarenosi TaxID=2528001 RepID=A0A5C6AMF7_9BACT|nr:DUF5698 domain-containing protein [Botrimarina colliarenosi]TWT99353.1 hypothetical protein Pla108_02900 [Botrimarina colliarenosi]
MPFLDTLPVWALALLIFSLRIVDVSLGTCRTIAVVQGRIGTSVLLGFFEVLIWITTVSEVFQRAGGNPWLLLSYAAGFACGNGAGIWLERRLAMGSVILRIVSHDAGDDLADALRQRSPRVLTFEGSDEEHAVTLLYVAARRRQVRRLISAAREVDPDLYYAVDPLRESNWAMAQPVPGPTGWRSVLKKK